MLKAILFALLFIVLGMIVFAFIAPILFSGANMEQVGFTASPFIIVISGVVGFIVGWRKRKKP